MNSIKNRLVRTIRSVLQHPFPRPAVLATPLPPGMRPARRSPNSHHRVGLGVCYAISTHFRVPVAIVRVLALAALVFAFIPTIAIYLAYGVILPIEEPVRPNRRLPSPEPMPTTLATVERLDGSRTSRI